MSDRLRELHRQRALLQDHLAWLDREIANAGENRSPASSVPVAPVVSPAPLTVAPVAVTSNPAPAHAPPPAPLGPLPAADTILEKYRVAPASLQQDVRKGCFLYFAAAFAVLALGVIALYYALRSD